MTIYEALRGRLGREPSNAEIKAELARIQDNTLIENATAGELSWQRKRKHKRSA